MSREGRTVYFTAETSNTVSVIDTKADAVGATFMLDARPRDDAFSPDGSRAYVPPPPPPRRRAEFVHTETYFPRAAGVYSSPPLKNFPLPGAGRPARAFAADAAGLFL